MLTQAKKSELLDIKKLEGAADKLKAIAHPVRIEIIRYLEEQGQANVTEIHQSLDLEQAVASQHLAVLRKKGLLEAEKKGKSCYYALRFEELSDIIRCIEKCSNE